MTWDLGATHIAQEDERLQTLSDNVYDAISKFDITRRQAYLRVNSSIPPEITLARGQVVTRSRGLLYVGLDTECNDCNSKYARLSMDQYLAWFMRLPYECEHRLAVTNMRVEPDEEEASRVPGMVKMSHTYVPLKPHNASESSVGELTAHSMEGHISRLERDAEAAELMITSARSYLESRPANPSVFPQLDRELLLNKAAAIRNEKQDAIELVTGILAEHRRISRELGSEHVASLTENLRNDEETGFLDDGLHLALGSQALDRPLVPRPGTQAGAGGEVNRHTGEGASLVTPQLNPSLQQELTQAESQERRRQRMDGRRDARASLMKTVFESLRSGVSVLRGRSQGQHVLPPTYPGGPLDRPSRSQSEPSVNGRSSLQVSPNSSPSQDQLQPEAGQQSAQSNLQPADSPDGGVGELRARFQRMDMGSEIRGRGDALGDSSPALNPRRTTPPVNLFGQPQRPGSRSARSVKPRSSAQVQQSTGSIVRHQSVIQVKRRAYHESVKVVHEEVEAVQAQLMAAEENLSWPLLAHLRARLTHVEEKMRMSTEAWEAYVESGASNTSIIIDSTQGTRDMTAMMDRVQTTRQKLSTLELEMTRAPQARGGSETYPASRPNTFIERLKLPKFSGAVPEYAHFKVLFSNLIAPSTINDTLFIEYLRNSLPPEHQYHLRGVVSRTEAWERLDDRFGDRVRSIRQVIKKLEDLELKGTPCEKVERLSFEVAHTEALLKSYDGQTLLPTNFNIVAILIDKLPKQYGQDWWDHCARATVEPIPGRNEWEVFLKWLEVKRKAAVKERGAEDLKPAPAKANTTLGVRASCPKCGGPHKAGACSRPSTLEVMAVENDPDGEPLEEAEMLEGVTVVATDGHAGAGVVKSAKYKECEERAGNCPDCHVPHTYQRVLRNGVRIQWPSEGFRSCPKYRALTPEERGKRIEEAKACRRCTSWAHPTSQCWIDLAKRPACLKEENGQACMRDHHSSLHGSRNKYCEAHATVNVSYRDGGEFVLLSIELVQCRDEQGKEFTAILFSDSGATITLCLHSWARRHNLRARPTSVYLRRLQEEMFSEVETAEYEFALKGVDGQDRTITAVGLGRLTEETGGGEITCLTQVFPELNPALLNRPTGQVEILLGQDYAAFLPRFLRAEGHLTLMSSMFGTGFVVAGRASAVGTHQRLTDGAVSMTRAVRALPRGALVNNVKASLPSFWEAEELGCRLPVHPAKGAAIASSETSI